MKDYWKDRVALEGECWIWQLCIGKNGYGFCKGSTAHRRSYEDHVGSIPPGQVIRHICGNKRCCNPSHLKLGSQRDNYYDMSEEQRIELHRKAGEIFSERIKSGKIKFSLEDLEQRRKAGKKGGEHNRGVPKSDSHKRLIAQSLRKG